MNGIKQIAYFGLSTLSLKVLGFALLPISTRILSQTEFGELTFLVSISAVMSLLLCLGLPELLLSNK
ncbi:oligosaccharide flippase family protein [Pseudoalteromonas sp. B62]|uniref:oligosaccharide flippase family protein n=1 Tax=Pseudoalteromonas sp. B62 TaxID=630483 RepID=UPI00301BC38F